MTRSTPSPAHPPGTTLAICLDLLRDGSVRLEADAAVASAVRPWIPVLPPGDPSESSPRALIRVGGGSTPAPPAPAAAPSFRLGVVTGWTGADGVVLARSPAGWVARVEVDAARADIRSHPSPRSTAEAVGAEFAAVATIAAGLLLGTLGFALAHAAAVVDASGRGWLLVGDTHSGKSTTCANLLRAGWKYLADDHVVLIPRTGQAPLIEGWPRPFKLDVGWSAGAQSVGRREAIDPRERWPGRWVPQAPLAGALFLRIQPGDSTIRAVHPAEALARLLPSAPWLTFDPPRAPSVLRFLSQVGLLPAFALDLGPDVHHSHERLRTLLAPLSP